ncbi:MAG: DUF2971 domain-containing protein [Alphaproteobacteria bacterium]|nr:DUF2971 domain-containing protein [Alphaproteobacteria bacterium]
MAFEEHPSFRRPSVTTKLWRYVDLPKFVALLTARKLWLTNAEVLAADDPHEGTLSSGQFAHRILKSVDDLGGRHKEFIIKNYSERSTEKTPEGAFNAYMMEQEQINIMTLSGRRNYFINCWHSAEHESVAMWRIYGSPGPGIAIISNSARIESAIDNKDKKIYIGQVTYFDEFRDSIDWSNQFNVIMSKRISFEYEKEVRIVYWRTGSYHDPISKFSWNKDTFRFEELIDNPNPLDAGIELSCDIDTLIECVIVSPLAPPWYAAAIVALRDKLGYKFPVVESNLLKAPATLA